MPQPQGEHQLVVGVQTSAYPVPLVPCRKGQLDGFSSKGSFDGLDDTFRGRIQQELFEKTLSTIRPVNISFRCEKTPTTRLSIHEIIVVFLSLICSV